MNLRIGIGILIFTALLSVGNTSHACNSDPVAVIAPYDAYVCAGSTGFGTQARTSIRSLPPARSGRVTSFRSQVSTMSNFMYRMNTEPGPGPTMIRPMSMFLRWTMLRWMQTRHKPM
jgi:hypothetical protein